MKMMSSGSSIYSPSLGPVLQVMLVVVKVSGSTVQRTPSSVIVYSLAVVEKLAPVNVTSWFPSTEPQRGEMASR